MRIRSRSAEAPVKTNSLMVVRFFFGEVKKKKKTHNKSAADACILSGSLRATVLIFLQKCFNISIQVRSRSRTRSVSLLSSYSSSSLCSFLFVLRCIWKCSKCYFHVICAACPGTKLKFERDVSTCRDETFLLRWTELLCEGAESLVFPPPYLSRTEPNRAGGSQFRGTSGLWETLRCG